MTVRKPLPSGPHYLASVIPPGFEIRYLGEYGAYGFFAPDGLRLDLFEDPGTDAPYIAHLAHMLEHYAERWIG